jgi:uncharacterized membrane protein
MPIGVITPTTGILPPIAQQTVQITWQGQYPLPEAIERYEKVLPGSFDRMIAMAERLEAAQIDESRRVHDYTHADSRRGHWLGFFAAVAAMLCSLAALAFGYPWVAGAFISVPVMGVAKALVDAARTTTPTDRLPAANKAATESQKVPANPPAPPSPAA